MCKLACFDERAPFGCAVNYCLNEDFPCNWVPGCNPPFGLSPHSTQCMRSCSDHESMLKTIFGLRTCSAAIQRHGCSNNWNRISDFCPHSCRTSKECPHRCGRDEAATVDGRQCWSEVRTASNAELTDRCVEAMRRGMDCHCKCGHIYLVLSGLSARSRGGAFTTRDRYNGEAIDINMTVTAGLPFTIDLTGEKMRDQDVAAVSGPRLRVVPRGEACGTSAIIPGLTGLDCSIAPGLSSLKLVCVTPPSLATAYLHRWSNVIIRRCGEFDICHCNGDCGQRSHWHNVGTVRTQPSLAVSGGVHKVYPGCSSFFTTPAPDLQISQNETEQEEIIRVAFSISGGLPSQARNIEAIKATLAGFLGSYSVLLDKQLPEAGDVTLRLEQGRRLLLAGNRQLQADSGACQDDDAAFLEETGKVGMPMADCAYAVAFLGDTNLLCTYITLKDAVERGCKRTCNLCGQTTAAGATPAPTSAPAASADASTSPPGPGAVVTTSAPPVVWPGGPSALRIRAEVKTQTNWHAEYVAARLHQLKWVPVVQARFIHRLYDLLGQVTTADVTLPDKLMVHVVGDPTRELVVPPPPPKREKSWKTSTIVFIIVGCAGAASVLCALTCAGVWYYRNAEEDEPKVMDEGSEVVTVSDGGYRTKRTWVEGEGASSATPKQKRKPRCACLWRCLSRFHKRFCTKKLRRVLPSAPVAGEITVGSPVKLTGLEQAHYNGLKGTVVDGPYDDSRYMVELVLVEDEVNPEYQYLSFRPENLKLWAPPVVQQPQGRAYAGGPQQPARGGGSYRSQAPARSAQPPGVVRGGGGSYRSKS
uniref:Uncharacterized protein n=1 Tax=Alexandrium monilatum TaxID=311494 RepID=A0A7S4URZ0_9DINO